MEATASLILFPIVLIFLIYLDFLVKQHKIAIFIGTFSRIPQGFIAMCFAENV